MIKFEDFFKVNSPKETKVKFNMHNSKGNLAWDLLRADEHEENYKKWIVMNSWIDDKCSPNYNLNKAKYLLTFAQYYPLGSEYYIFGGMYKVEKIIPEVSNGIGYKLTLMDNYVEYRKRLIVKLDKSISREIYNKPYINVQKDFNPEVYEMLPTNTIDLGPFPGYDRVILSFDQLKEVETSVDWKEALRSVKGIYCITDKSNGKLYIGSATGTDGIFGRWKNYIESFDGGNLAFKEKRNGENGVEYIKENFQYSILEVFDTKIRQTDILKKEYHWMKVFQSVHRGYNNDNSREKLDIKSEENDLVTEKKFKEEENY